MYICVALSPSLYIYIYKQAAFIYLLGEVGYMDQLSDRLQ